MAYKTTDEYINSFPKEKKEILEKMRRAIKEAVPEAEEAMGYGVAAFKLNGKYLVYYAAFANHVGIYPTSKIIEMFKKELEGYKTAKGTVQFQLNEQIPYELIKKMAKASVKIIKGEE